MPDTDNIVPISADMKAPEAAPPGPPAAEQLRAFEDKHFGKDAPRHEGKVERGYGSKHRMMKDAEKAEHAALERLVEAEEHLQKAVRELAIAQDRHAAANAAVASHASRK